MSKTKKELEEEIKILKHNNDCLENTINIQAARLSIFYQVLEKEGYTIAQINNMLKLTCEKS